MTWNIKPGSLSNPLIIGHRGDSGSAPENTLEAFHRALEVGADGIELDVRLTRDRQVAVFHDRRVDRTTNAQGPVGTFTLAELKELDAGSWFDPRFKSARMPTLEEVFQEMPESFLINVELKVTGTGVLSLASKVAKVVRRLNRFESVLVCSFNPIALGLMRLLEPRIMRGYIWSRPHPLPARARWPSPHWMNPDKDTFTPQMLERFHRHWKRMLVREEDVGLDLDGLASMGLDAIVTDNPQEFVKLRG